MATLNTVFKQVYGEVLKPLGFVKLKGRYPYFVRLIGDEIIRVITFINRDTSMLGHKAFSIRCGVATVYRKRISLDESPLDNSNWFTSNLGIYRTKNPFVPRDIASAMFEKLYTSAYKPNDDSMLKVVKHSLEETKEFILPVLNEVNDIKACIEYFNMFCPGLQNLYYEEEEFGNTNPNNFYNEGLLYIKYGSCDYYIENMERRLQRQLAMTAHRVKTQQSGYTQKRYDDEYKGIEEHKDIRIAHANKIFSDREWSSAALTELEQRKLANIEILKSYGFHMNQE